MYDNRLHKSRAEASRLAESFAAYLDESQLVFAGEPTEARDAVVKLFTRDINYALSLYHTFVDRWSLRTTATALGVKSHATIITWNKKGMALIREYVTDAREKGQSILVNPTTASAPS